MSNDDQGKDITSEILKEIAEIRRERAEQYAALTEKIDLMVNSENESTKKLTASLDSVIEDLREIKVNLEKLRNAKR